MLVADDKASMRSLLEEAFTGRGFVVTTAADGDEAVACLQKQEFAVVITDLNIYCMPFIRYRIGDLAMAVDDSVPCKCGRGLPRIGRIEGRVQSIILGAGDLYVPAVRSSLISSKSSTTRSDSTR